MQSVVRRIEGIMQSVVRRIEGIMQSVVRRCVRTLIGGDPRQPLYKFSLA